MEPRRNLKKRNKAGNGTNPATREALLDALHDVLRGNPRNDPTVSEVADVAGVNTALVGYYFAGKEGMITALTQRILSSRLADLDWLVTQPLSPTQKLRLLIVGTIVSAERFPYLERLMNRACELETEIELQIALNLVQPIFSRYVAILQEGIDQGEFVPHNPTLLYYNIIGACYRLFTLGDILHKINDLTVMSADVKQVFVQQTTALLMRGILMPKAPGRGVPGVVESATA